MEQRAGPDHQEEPMMNAPFVTKELEDALTTLKAKKAPSPDNVTNEMLLHLVPRLKKKLLQLFNDGWRTGTVLQVWREGFMIPILKKGKDKSKADSYRPVILSSCMGKLMERLINTMSCPVCSTLRMMTGAMRSMPISAMETVTGLQPIEDRQEIKVLTQTAKFKRLRTMQCMNS